MKREKAKQDPGYIIWLNRLAVAAAIAALQKAVHIMKNAWPVGIAGFLAPERITMQIFRLCVPGKWKPLPESNLHAGTDCPVFDLGISDVPSLDPDGVRSKKKSTH